jgi:hypothetical protein
MALPHNEDQGDIVGEDIFFKPLQKEFEACEGVFERL